MSVFRNLNIQLKLLFGFAGLLGLLLLVSIIVMLSRSQSQSKISEMFDVHMRRAELAQEISLAMFKARQAEKDYLLNYSRLGFADARAQYVDRVEEYVGEIDQLGKELQALPNGSEQTVTATADLVTTANQYQKNFLTLVDLIERRGHKDAGLVGQFRTVIHQLEDTLLSLENDRLRVDMLTLRRHEKDYLLRGEIKYVDSLHQTVNQFKEDVRVANLEPEVAETLTSTVDEYQVLFDQLVQLDDLVAANTATYEQSVARMIPLVDSIRADALNTQNKVRSDLQASAQITGLVIGGVSMGALLAGVVFAVLLSNSLSVPIVMIAQGAQRLSMGDAELVDMDWAAIEKINARRDELGDVGRAFSDLLTYFKEMAAAATRITAGDLTVQVKPRGEADLLGNALCGMVSNLRKLVADVADNTQTVNATSQQLSLAILQSEQATQQITTTIRQVGKGITSQSEDSIAVTEMVNQMSHSIEDVARGSQEQAADISHSVEMTEQISLAIQQVSHSAKVQVKEAHTSVDFARTGTRTVAETSQGMEVIKTKVGVAAQKVREMGARSRQIDKILDTIDNIASQTNLLALNAAIEAARAGAKSHQIGERLLDHHLTAQAQLLAELLVQGEQAVWSVAFWEALSRRSMIDTFCITDEDGVIVHSNEAAQIGFRFSEDPKEQTCEFRRLIHQRNGVLCQPAQARSLDNLVFKYVGVSRRDQPGIVQVGFQAETLAQFRIQTGGFAVVADEVRSLAEKSAVSTKEIASLIKNIQQTITEAVQAMDEGTTAVNNGVRLAEEAKQSLTNLETAAVKSRQLGEQTAVATDDVSKLIAKLVDRFNNVSAVVEENTATTQELAAGSNDVREAVERVTTVAQQNSAAVQEVTAAVETINAQVEQMAAMAHALPEMSLALQQAINQFQLNGRSFTERRTPVAATGFRHSQSRHRMEI